MIYSFLNEFYFIMLQFQIAGSSCNLPGKDKSNNYKVMNINEILQTGANVTLAIGINELREWHREVIADTRRELEQVVMSDKAESYPTVKQVAEILNVHNTTLWRWDKKGYLKTIEFGGGRRYKMSDVKALLNGGAK
jgi:excisionase family DNA binding protein